MLALASKILWFCLEKTRPENSSKNVPPLTQARWRGEMVELSWRPRATLFKSFLTPEECESLIALVRPHFYTLSQDPSMRSLHPGMPHHQLD